ncbi:MAG: anthranilate synthase component I family protein [Thermoleophilia bacterium]|nr:anthranilate synthase component I family protein [Thermoleophilia bacterium]
MPGSDLLTPARSVSHRQVSVELVNPVGLIRRLGLPGSGPFVLLDSAGGNPDLCRYSFLAWSPRLSVTIRHGAATLRGPDVLPSDESPPVDGTLIEISDPFLFLRELQESLAPDDLLIPDEARNLPITGGAFGLVSYDAGRYIEALPHIAVDDLDIPDFDIIFPRRLICYDHGAGVAHLVFEDAAPGELEEVESALRRQAIVGAPDQPEDIGRDEFKLSSGTSSNLTSDGYQEMVRRAREYILDGDIFQSNLSQRLELDYDGDSLELYDALRAVNPSPFAGYLELDGYQIISSSPERLVQLQGRQAQTRPIAGTRRRGVDCGEDDCLVQELNLDPKECAEHIMLVDLERNDMGRVCDYGSVSVNELMVNEAYSHVIHIVSNVQGELHEKKDAVDLLRAMFPGGTITGCPKVRCMEIIDELEPVRRGPYTGSFGYIGYNGDMDMNIIIRTLVRRGDRVYMQAGAGIVADSDPEREYHESLRKAEAMVRAVELAKRRSAARGAPRPGANRALGTATGSAITSPSSLAAEA